MIQMNLIFENLSKFYFEGEVVRIKLEISLEKPCSLNNLVANFVGLAVLRPSENTEKQKSKKGKGNQSGEVIKEIYFDDVIPLFVTENKEAAMWSSGIQVFTFVYQLPHHTPTSIEFPLGFVRYSVHVHADCDEETVKLTEHFTIVAKTDLNKNVSAHLPGIIWNPESQCFFQALICQTKQVRAFMHIAKKGYVPGECIFINAEISNFHRGAVEWVKAVLVQVLKFSNLTKVKRVVTEVTRGCILSCDTQTWRSESLLIPAVPPTSYGPKKMVKIKYHISFQYKPSWEKRPVKLKQKIIIGTVRLLEVDQGNEQGQGEGESVYKSKLFNGSNLEPCIFGPHCIDEEQKSKTFSPLYPIYVEV